LIFSNKLGFYYGNSLFLQVGFNLAPKSFMA
jgi:hypothetical protein